MHDPAVLTEVQLACLASPVRNEVFSALRTLGQASVRELSARCGRSPEATHYHVKALLEAGLIREVCKRPSARKPEVVYESVAEAFQLPNLRKEPDLAPLVRKAVRAGLRHTSRSFDQAARMVEKNPDLQPFMHVLRGTFRLSEEDAWEFLGKIEAIDKLIEERRSEEGIQLHWSSIVYPDAK